MYTARFIQPVQYIYRTIFSLLPENAIDPEKSMLSLDQTDDNEWTPILICVAYVLFHHLWCFNSSILYAAAIAAVFLGYTIGILNTFWQI